MKKLVLIFILLRYAPVFPQTNSAQPSITDPQSYGYVNGIRLDSLNAEYAQFEWGVHRLFLDYGQEESRKKTMVTDVKGNPLLFARQSVSFGLNFLYFNGWQFVQAYYNQGDKTDMVILKRRQNNK